MQITHDIEQNRAITVVNGYTAYVEYIIENDSLDILHTYVSQEIEGQGIAAELVKFVYDYAISNSLKTCGTCRYASVWLKRHPEYLFKD